MATVLITGVSSGVGHALAKAYLEEGGEVWGVSRRMPHDLRTHPDFHFAALDLNLPLEIPAVLSRLLNGLASLDLVILNAGRLGEFGDLAEADLAELKTTMQINVWANKLVLDSLYEQEIQLKQVVAISSGASVNGNRGWSGYSISKAALNMLTKLYAQERPETHFCALAPGIVDTEIQDELLTREPDDRFPAVESLRSKRGTPEMPTSEAAAPKLIKAISHLPEWIESGDYADVRKPPLAEA